ncbi:MAG TPA: hypothetical protein VI251_15565 [Pseudolabrys sp.]
MGKVQLRRPEIIDLQLEIFQRLPIRLAEVSLSAKAVFGRPNRAMTVNGRFCAQSDRSPGRGIKL